MKGEQGLKTIRKRIIVFGAGTGVCFIIFLWLLFQEANEDILFKETVLLVTILLEVALASFLIKAIYHFKIAKLIMENQILHIQSAKTETFHNKHGEKVADDSAEVFISCFGMLLNAKVVKFNLDHIHLIKVEIGNRYIELIYGTHVKLEKTRILHDEMSDDELESIITKFRYETGIIPIVLRAGKEGN